MPVALLILFSLLLLSAPDTDFIEVSPINGVEAKTVLYSMTDSTPIPSELLGQFDPAHHSDFILVPDKYGNKSGMYLRKETMKAFRAMKAEADKEGLPMIIMSATRNFDAQKLIWENKWTGKTKVGGKSLAISLPNPLERSKKIMELSAMPGTSRHHWGTDIDFNALDNAWFMKPMGKKWYEWMLDNASKFGFCQAYTQKGSLRPNGYNEEKWHWSYTPLSKIFLKSYLEQIQISHISGFKGAECAEELQVIQHYVKGVSAICQ
ncbi:MAG: M15 family metallopeptidase [Saprospiraceae bacterium]